MGFFDKIKQGLTKTKTKMDAQLTGIFAAYEPGDEEFFEDLEETLILADTGVETTTKAIAQLRRLLAKRHHLGFKLLGTHGTGLGRLRKLGQLRLKLVDVGARLGDRLIRLQALALHIGELAARGRERIGGALCLGRRRLRSASALGQLLGEL